jgi:hypothetical protein
MSLTLERRLADRFVPDEVCSPLWPELTNWPSGTHNGTNKERCARLAVESLWFLAPDIRRHALCPMTENS